MNYCKWCGCRLDKDVPLCDDCMDALNASKEAIENRKRNVKREVE
jgi:predicted amidophosphoribosyltransferase